MLRAGIAFSCLVTSVGCMGAEAQVPNPAEQIAQAQVAAPTDKAEAATIMGYADDGSVVEIRAGSNDLICLADNPADERFSASCYHESLEPYFARGRSLNAEGSPREDRYRIRFEEMSSGDLASPVMSATQYIFDGQWDGESQTADGTVRWVIYVPGATAESTGLSQQPQEGGPWIMFPGTPGAHIMIVPPGDQ